MTSIAQNAVAESSHLVHSAISPHDKGDAEFVAAIEIYSGMSKVCYPDVASSRYDITNNGGRGAITGFSRKSRRRMMEAMMKKSNYIRPLFLTLTYTDESIGHFPAARDYKRDIDCLNKRLQHEYPGGGHIWRVEFMTRKSGALTGYRVPHYHLIVDGVLDDIADLRKVFRDWWHEIITDGYCYSPSPRVDVQTAKSKRHAMYYLSKYVAKETANNNIADGHQHNYFDGRHWAVSGNWQTTVVKTVKLTRQEFIDFRRLCCRWLKSRGSAYARGLAKSRSYQGFSIYGLGIDVSDGDAEATITKMLIFVTGLYRC